MSSEQLKKLDLSDIPEEPGWTGGVNETKVTTFRWTEWMTWLFNLEDSPRLDIMLDEVKRSGVPVWAAVLRQIGISLQHICIREEGLYREHDRCGRYPISNVIKAKTRFCRRSEVSSPLGGQNDLYLHQQRMYRDATLTASIRGSTLLARALQTTQVGEHSELWSMGWED